MTHTASNFLHTVAAFRLLPEDTLHSLNQQLRFREIPAGTTLYRQNHSQLKELSIIVSGQVEKFFLDEHGQRVHRETFGPGDTFGAISMLLNNRRAIRSVEATEATTIYQLPQEQFEQLCRDYPEFYDHFASEFGRRMLQSGYAARLTPKPDHAENFQRSDLAFSISLRELSSTQVHCVAAEQSIQSVAQAMNQYSHDYALVMQDQQPVGIVTDPDLRKRVVAAGLSPDTSVAQIMSHPVLDISPEAKAYEAILLMYRHKVTHLLVRDWDGYLGMVTLDRLLQGQGTSPFLFLNQISQASSTDELRSRWQRMPEIIDQLLERGAKPTIVNQILSSISNAIAVNVVERAIRIQGAPPAPFVFMALGSEGRREQTLSTDQDNAIIYADVEKSQREAVRAYFLRLGERICDDLHEIGFEYCPGGLMAKNPKWNHSLSHWKDNYRTWVTEPMGKNAMIGSTFFDCRTIYGSPELWNDLRSHLFELLKGRSQGFLSQLARAALANKPPLTIFGSLQFDLQNDKRKVLNIKRAMQAISDFARIYALNHNLLSTNTGERLWELRKHELLTEEEYQELSQAFYFMMRLRLTHQAQQLQNQEQPDNLLGTEELTRIEKVTLKQIFKLVEKYQKQIGLVFAGTMMG